MQSTPLQLALLAGLLLNGNAQAQPKRPPARVVVEQVVKKEVAEGRSFVGTVWPLRVSKVGSAAPGRIEKLYVREGEPIKKGAPLAKLRTKTIEAQVDAARAARDARKAEMEEMEAGNRPEEIAQANAQLESAQTMHDFRQQQLKRARSLRRGREISTEAMEEAMSQANQADAMLRVAKANLALLKAGFRKEKIAQATARYREQDAMVRHLEEQLARHTIVAPFDGYVMSDHAEEGQWVMQGMLIAEVAEMQSVDVQAEVLEDYISRIRKGDTARVTLDALPGKIFTGKIAVILPRGDNRARTFPVKVRVKNPGEGVLLKAGMFARVTFSVGKKITAVMVPKDALVLGGRSPVVHVYQGASDGTGNGTVTPVPVEIGVSEGNLIQVSGELEAGQWVVTQGNERLRPGQPVKAVRAEP